MQVVLLRLLCVWCCCTAIPAKTRHLVFVKLYFHSVFEGSLEVKLPTIWRDEKAVSREKSQRRKDQKKEDAGARQGRKVAIHCVFSWFCGSGGSKSRLAKAAGAEAAGQIRDEKLHAVVARSTFPSQNAQNTSGADHFWKLRCRKSARRCGAKHKCTKHTMLGPLLEVDFRKSARGAKHISKSKCTKHTMLGPLLEGELSKQCTQLWREAHFQVKCTKHTMLGPLLEVEFAKNCTPLWREAHFQVKMHKAHHARTTFGCWDAFTTLHYITVLS